MSIVVRNNMPVLQTVNMVGRNSAAFGKSLLRVSSGMRINNASDDTSGYSISERMQVMMRGLHQDTRNAQTGNSLLKVAQGAVSSTVEILKSLKEGKERSILDPLVTGPRPFHWKIARIISAKPSVAIAR